MNAPGYESLAAVLQRAFDQAAIGKGAARHADARPFHEQPMQTISELLGDHTGLLYQAMKKVQESKRMKKEPAINELLGAINYLAGAIIFLERDDAVEKKEPPLVWPPIAAELLAAEGLTQMPQPSHWFCSHGDASKPELRAIVPIGEACPVCYSTK